MRTAPPETRRRRLQALCFLLAGGLLLMLLWHTLAPATQAPVMGAEPVVRTVDWVVRDGHPVSGPQRVVAQTGERLLLRVRTDHADELHVHGYELSRHLPANHLQVITLDLTRSGRFEVELHHAQQTLTVLEVQPR